MLVRVRRPRLAAAVVLALSLLAAGCTGAGSADEADTGSGVTVDPDASGEADVTVDLRRFDFRPSEVEIAAGQTVVFTNGDQTQHTVTSEGDDGAAFDAELDGRGATVAITFDEPGTYAFRCRPHEFMTGTVTVTE